MMLTRYFSLCLRRRWASLGQCKICAKLDAHSIDLNQVMLYRFGRCYHFRGSTAEEINGWIEVTTLMCKEHRNISSQRHTRTWFVGSAGLLNERLDYGHEIRLVVWGSDEMSGMNFRARTCFVGVRWQRRPLRLTCWVSVGWQYFFCSQALHLFFGGQRI